MKRAVIGLMVVIMLACGVVPAMAYNTFETTDKVVTDGEVVGFPDAEATPSETTTSEPEQPNEATPAGPDKSEITPSEPEKPEQPATSSEATPSNASGGNSGGRHSHSRNNSSNSSNTTDTAYITQDTDGDDRVIVTRTVDYSDDTLPVTGDCASCWGYISMLSGLGCCS